MATSGVLTKTIAHATGVHERTVAMVVRELRTTGLLRTGARGVNAPHMLPIDAARVLIAILVSERPVDAPKAVRDFGSLECGKITPRNVPPTIDHGFILELPERHLFEDGLAFVIQKYAQAPWGAMSAPFLKVSASVNNMQAEIELLTHRYCYFYSRLLDMNRQLGSSSIVVNQEDRDILAQFGTAAEEYNILKIHKTHALFVDALVQISADFAGD